MLEISSILSKAANKCGLERTRYTENEIPLSMSDIVVMPFFGDIRSTIVLSSLLLKRYREEVKGSKYFILCSWNGYEGLFPYVNEFWSIKGEAKDRLFSHTDGFENNSDMVPHIHRNLNCFFENVITAEELKSFYDGGILQEYFDRFKQIKCFKPALPSSAILGNDFNRELNKRSGNKVFIYPVIYVKELQQGRMVQARTCKEFWCELAKHLIHFGYVPILYQGQFTHDLSDTLPDVMKIYDDNVLSVLTAMRTVGCVLDVFGEISRLAIMARCPFVAVDERLRYNNCKENEIDGLCGYNIPREYLFSFSNIILHGDKNVWHLNLFYNIISKLEKIFFDFNREAWPSTMEQNEVVLYSKVKQQKSKKFGTRFIKVPRT